ncbi:MAG: VWA domain-containing protein [Methanobrevibacter millerae]|uniref:VWA domain-containing protein n=1 Tax=Methanobrevibacter millerae TaxID=230361 RepID=A0A8T3VE70_9EURY|nr:vWA domain-containing protein [Methanobrevibacter millerae]MBE6504526.1 VWA domain-containing protein [Methanobrevibacter millerae]
MESEKIDIIFLIDRSGSMYGSENDTIGGFNSFIAKQKENETDARVTTILFDHGYEVLYKRKNIYEIDDLTRNEYYVRGSTALLDAIGRTITSMDREIDNKVLFVITTDGYENSSKEFTRQQIKNIINNHNWEFIYLGADIDSYAEASSIGIRSSRIFNYRKTSEGINRMYECLSDATINYSKFETLDDSWKERLEE